MVASAAVLGLGAGGLLLPGCTSPPAVTRLLRSTRSALRSEANHVKVDVKRDRQSLAQSRRSLAAAFDADLRETDTLTPRWVREATRAYVAAREGLLRHELALKRERRVRAENLLAAARATDRALKLLHKQDRLIATTTHFDVWKMLDPDGAAAADAAAASSNRSAVPAVPTVLTVPHVNPKETR